VSYDQVMWRSCIIVKEMFPDEDFEGIHDPERQYLADRLQESELEAYRKLIELQGDVVPYFYGMVRTDLVHQGYRSRGILIEYLVGYQTLYQVASERVPSTRPFNSTLQENLQPAIPTSLSSRSEAYIPSIFSGGPFTAPTFANRSAISISLSDVKENSRKSLAKIHESGVLHGDISDRNILVNSQANVVYVDFGFARPFSEKGGELEWERWRQMWRTIEREPSETLTSV
jgi:hypothetical protein